MPEYRRVYIPGGTYFLTIVTYKRRTLFQTPENISQLRSALKTVKSEMPFEILGAVILPDHLHFIWTLPSDDTAYALRVGRLKALFTKSLPHNQRTTSKLSDSRRKRRESGVWQRRFWEHTIRNEDDFQHYLDYIHYNPVKHGYVPCPHLWPFSSFHQWVRKGAYPADWCCQCHNRQPTIPDLSPIEAFVGESAGARCAPYFKHGQLT